MQEGGGANLVEGVHVVKDFFCGFAVHVRRFFELHGRHEKRNVLLVDLASFGEYSTQLFLN